MVEILQLLFVLMTIALGFWVMMAGWGLTAASWPVIIIGMIGQAICLALARS